MKKKKRVWVVEFEEPTDDLVNDEWFGILRIEKDGVVHYYHRTRTVWFKWKLKEVTSSPRYRLGLPTWKLARLGVHPRASRFELMHPSGRSQAPHPTPLFKEWATRYIYLAKYLNLSHPPLLAYPHAYACASNKKIKEAGK